MHKWNVVTLVKMALMLFTVLVAFMSSLLPNVSSQGTDSYVIVIKMEIQK